MENQSVGVVPASSDEILDWWQTAHFPLTNEQQVRFKKDPEIANLRKLHREAIKEVILLNKIAKLKDIYLVATALQAAKMPRTVTGSTLVENNIRQTPTPRLSKFFTRTTTSRGRNSFREHGMINPPPVQSLNIDRSKLPKCSICNQSIIGTMCGCW